MHYHAQKQKTNKNYLRKKIICNIVFLPKCRYLKSIARNVEVQVTNTLLLCVTNYLEFNVFRWLMNYNHIFYSEQLAQYDCKVTFSFNYKQPIINKLHSFLIINGKPAASLQKNCEK